ncbi:MAG: serine/threonine protein phosphatase [Dictyoglomus sp. NZ13-RE01]|nr:MAG: serine/threonine protein phosphatase [Dictyoglomus sp. NZ13-RE01]
MKVLALADFESPALYERFNHTPYKGVEAVISCGDVLPELLEYLVDVLNVPVFYVLGNHDERYLKEPPKGCENIDGKIITFGGMRILGLGGSQRYSDGVLQYTEKEMSWRIRKLYFKLRKGVDIIVTHAPPYGIHEGNDYAHRGFKVFLDLINKYQPLYFLHGHTHMNYNFRSSRISQIGRTKIINCSGFVVLDL